MLKLIAVISGGLLVLAGLLYLMQRSIIFPAPPGALPETLPDGVENVLLNEGHAFLLKSAEGDRPSPLLVYAHGNAELAQWSIETFDVFRERGFAVLLLEYPGYANTNGSPSAASIEVSALGAIDEVTSRADIDADRLVVYGRSIGSGAACAIARNRDVAVLVLESPFYSLKDLVAEKGFPSFLLRDKFDNAAVIAEMDAPIFLYHGVADTLIPFSHSERLREMASDATLVRGGCGHNDCPRPWPQLFEFLNNRGVLTSGDAIAPAL